jgi:hypothetical protein
MIQAFCLILSSMSWGAKRKLIVFLVLIVALGVVVGLPAFFTFYKAPTCFDGVQNQGEEGVDCGGPCAKLCQAGFAAPQELWATSSEVVSGVYNLIAYAANPNANVSASAVPYDFKLYDTDGILVAERAGMTDIPAQSHFAVFEPSVTTGNRVPFRTFFQFTSPADWIAASSTGSLSVTSSNFTAASTTSGLDAMVLNSSLSEEDNIDLIAILYDTSGNVLAFSKTLIPAIMPNTPTDVSFTWPYPIHATIARKEFLFQDNPSL